MTDNELMALVKHFQRAEATERDICLNIAQRVADGPNKVTLLKLAAEEARHYAKWKQHTGVDVKPFRSQVWFYTAVAALLGYTFAIKQMEARLNRFQNEKNTALLVEKFPEMIEINAVADAYEAEIIGNLDEKRLRYVSSIVLGLNDALVEFTGSLAGYTFAMQSNQFIAMAGLITGISASLSMASSEYLSTRAENGKNALNAAVYTGLSYVVTVAILLAPYLILPDQSYGIALAIMLLLVVVIIATFNYYIAIAQELSFWQRFSEMAAVSLGVAAISFSIGLLVKNLLRIEL